MQRTIWAKKIVWNRTHGWPPKILPIIHKKNPAYFYMLGVGNIDMGIQLGLHTPKFDLDESAIEIGGGLMDWFAVHVLNTYKKQNSVAT